MFQCQNILHLEPEQAVK